MQCRIKVSAQPGDLPVPDNFQSVRFLLFFSWGIEANDLLISQLMLDSMAEKLERKALDSRGFGGRRTQVDLHFGRITSQYSKHSEAGGVLCSAPYLIGSLSFSVEVSLATQSGSSSFPS